MLVSLVSIHYLPRICDPIVVPQVFPSANVIFSGIGVLLSVSTIFDLSLPVIMTLTFFKAAKDVEASQDVLVDVFERIENFIKRLESYTEVPPTAAMTDVTVKIMVEVLSILAISTKEINQGRSSE